MNETARETLRARLARLATITMVKLLREARNELDGGEAARTPPERRTRHQDLAIRLRDAADALERAGSASEG